VGRDTAADAGEAEPERGLRKSKGKYGTANILHGHSLKNHNRLPRSDE
jgi:hypothetical protein